LQEVIGCWFVGVEQENRNLPNILVFCDILPPAMANLARMRAAKLLETACFSYLNSLAFAGLGVYYFEERSAVRLADLIAVLVQLGGGAVPRCCRVFCMLDPN